MHRIYSNVFAQESPRPGTLGSREVCFMDPEGASLPPIEVYQVGDVYFVLDGNHRVSIARQEGVEFIDAHVIEMKTPVP